MKNILIVILLMLPAGLFSQTPKKSKSLPPVEFVGIWQNNDFPITLSLYLNADGTGEFDGEAITYKIEGSNFILNSDGFITKYQYKIHDYKLTLSGGDLDLPVTFVKNNTTYKKEANEVDELDDNGVKKSNIIRGKIDGELVGNWCYINIYNPGATEVNKDECITINADGLYTFHSNAFAQMSKKNSDKNEAANDSTSTENIDTGEWRLDGKTMYILSKSIGFKSFSVEKRKHPKTNVPLLIINGRAYMLSK